MNDHMDRNRNKVVFAGMDEIALNMLVDNMKQLHEDGQSNQAETRQEFAKVRDQITDLRADMNQELRKHDKVITELDTQAKMAGKISGRIAGAIAGLVVSLCLYFFKAFVSL